MRRLRLRISCGLLAFVLLTTALVPAQPARADIFGGDVAVLSQILVEVIEENRRARSIVERPLFDGQAVVLKVKSISPFTSKDPGQSLDVAVERPVIRDEESEIDFSAVDAAKLVGKGEANLSTKRLYIEFSELITRDGQNYPIQGQALDPESRSAGIEGDYSSGLPARLLGIALDRVINVTDEVGVAHVFSAAGPDGPTGQDFKRAAMETNQHASQDIAAEATKDLRGTPAEISLPVGTEFLVRVRASPAGGAQ